MMSSLFRFMVISALVCGSTFGNCLLGEAHVSEPLKLYYEENAQIELINAEGARVLIDVHDPGALSSPPTEKDILLTTHNHGDHRRLGFVSSFPGKQLDVEAGEIEQKGISILGIASAHNEGDDFKKKGGTNYIFVVEMSGLRIAHFGDIGQKALTPEQLKLLGTIDIAITQLSNNYSNMTVTNKKGFNLMDQVQPKLIIPTHIHNPMGARMAADKWEAFESYKKSLLLTKEKMPGKTTIIFMGRNADLIKVPYTNL